MQAPPPDFAAELAGQLAFLSAVLGGFAATFAGTLLAVDSPRRAVGWALSAAVVAAAALIVATVAFTGAVLAIRSGSEVQIASLPRYGATALGSFVVGLYGLFGALGLSGWVRSRRAGWVTTSIAVVGALLATSALVAVG